MNEMPVSDNNLPLPQPGYKRWQQIVYSPLIGSTLATIIFVIYAIISGLKDIDGMPLSSATSIMNIIGGVMFATPLLWILFSVISLVVSLVAGSILLKIKTRFNWSEGVFWFTAFLSGLTIGSLLAWYNYHSEHHLVKDVLIVFAFSFGSLFNASFYSVLSGKIRKSF